VFGRNDPCGSFRYMRSTSKKHYCIQYLPRLGNPQNKSHIHNHYSCTSIQIHFSTVAVSDTLVLGVAVDLRNLHVLCLLALEVLGSRNIVSAFLVFDLLGQLSDTEEVIHFLERKTLGLRDTVRRFVSANLLHWEGCRMRLTRTRQRGRRGNKLPRRKGTCHSLLFPL